MTRASPRKRQPVNYNEDKDEPTHTKRVAAKVHKVVKAVAKKASKRKAEAEPEHEESQETPAPAPAKKRKAKATAKADDSMPLAQRAAVASLGKAMYIGAHVSAAGGMRTSLCPSREGPCLT